MYSLIIISFIFYPNFSFNIICCIFADLCVKGLNMYMNSLSEEVIPQIIYKYVHASNWIMLFACVNPKWAWW